MYHGKGLNFVKFLYMVLGIAGSCFLPTCDGFGDGREICLSRAYWTRI